MQLPDFLSPVAPDMQLVDRVVRERLASQVPLIETVAEYIIAAGGKRMRPALLLLVAQAVKPDAQHRHLLAAVVEFIHTATLLHDDVVDESEMRRGRQTANALFGNATSVLVGDFLYSRAFQMMVEPGDMRIMRILADATNVIAEGEVLQLLNVGDPNVSEARYMQVVRYKTARLFEAAAELGALLAGASESVRQQAALYGRHVGTAFQLIDDVLDYTGDAEALGKNLGDDLREGKPTLPLIRLLEQGDSEVRALVVSAIEQGSADVAAIRAALDRSDALQYTRSRAVAEAALAVDQLQAWPDSESLRSLLQFRSFVVDRLS